MFDLLEKVNQRYIEHKQDEKIIIEAEVKQQQTEEEKKRIESELEESRLKIQ